MYSARHGCWVRCVTEDMGYDVDLRPFSLRPHDVFLGRARGFLFWSANDGDVLVLDESTGEFSTFTLALTDDDESYYRRHDMENIRAVGGGGAGTVRFVRAVGDELEVLAWEHWRKECVLERRLGLSHVAGPDRTWCFSDTMAEATLRIVAVSPSSSGIVLSLDLAAGARRQEVPHCTKGVSLPATVATERRSAKDGRFQKEKM